MLAAGQLWRVLRSEPERSFPWTFSLFPSSVRWSHEPEPSTVGSAYRETWPQELTWMTGWAHAETSQAQARGITLDAPRYPGGPLLNHGLS